MLRHFVQGGQALLHVWKDPSGNLADEQHLLAHVSSRDSLSKALASGDFVLVSDSGDAASRPRPSGQSARRPRLADYL